MNETELRYHLYYRQDGLCVCGHTLGQMAIHEVWITKGDLPKDKRVRHPINCVVVHNDMPCGLGGHIHNGHTAAYQKVCCDYLLSEYGIDEVQNWIRSLQMKDLPGLAKEIINDR